MLVENDHVWIRNIVQFVHMLPKPRLQVDCPNAKVVFLEETFLIEVGQRQSFRELGTMLFRLPLHLMMQIRVEHFTKQPRPTDFVCELLAVEKDFDLYLGGYFLCTIRACERPLRPASVDEPANLYGIPTVHQGSALPFGPFDPEDLMFAQAIENLENLNCITSYPGSTFVIWAEKNLWAFTPFDGTEEHFATRIKTAFDRLVPSEKAVVTPLHKHFRWRTEFEETTTVLFESPRPRMAPRIFESFQDPHPRNCVICTMVYLSSTLAPPRMGTSLSLCQSLFVQEVSMMCARSDMSSFQGLHLLIGVSLPVTQKGGPPQTRSGTSPRSLTGRRHTFSS